MSGSSLLPSPSRRDYFPTSSAGTWAARDELASTALGRGALGPEALGPEALGRDPFRKLVVGFDHWLSRRAGMLEFSTSPSCMLRVAPTLAQTAITLSDGVAVGRGDPILELHFWNERIPQASATRGLGWGGRFGRQLIRSFGDLAVAVERDPRLADAVALRGRLSFAGARNRDEMRRFARWFALETPVQARRPSLAGRIYDVGEDIWQLALTYAYNPGCLRDRQARRVRDDLWMSRATLLARYGRGSARTLKRQA